MGRRTQKSHPPARFDTRWQQMLVAGDACFGIPDDEPVDDTQA
jgi:hypothetical protein